MNPIEQPAKPTPPLTRTVALRHGLRVDAPHVSPAAVAVPCFAVLLAVVGGSAGAGWLAPLVMSMVLLPVVGALEHNHRRQPQPHARLSGTSDVEDRDLDRVRGEVRGRRGF